MPYRHRMFQSGICQSLILANRRPTWSLLPGIRSGRESPTYANGNVKPHTSIDSGQLLNITNVLDVLLNVFRLVRRVSIKRCTVWSRRTLLYTIRNSVMSNVGLVTYFEGIVNALTLDDSEIVCYNMLKESVSFFRDSYDCKEYGC